MSRNKRYTLKEIAELAEVSRATVDRVIHGRGNVSEYAYKRITKILDSINYQPNFIAQTLKKGDFCKVAILIPDFEYDIYWKKALDGIDKTLNDLSLLGFSGDKYLFNPYKTASFKFNSKQILEGDYNGVLIAPFFFNESIEFFKSCDSIGLPYVTFNTHIKNANPLSHVGQDLIQSGKTAAGLLHKLIKEDEELLVLHIDEDTVNSKHMQEKENGFRNYFKENGYADGRVKVLKVNNTKQVEKALLTTLNDSPKIQGIFVSTSKVYFIADIKQAYELKHKLIGYDLIPKNISHLNSGIIDFLIYQNPESQASQGINLLADHLVFHKVIPDQKLLPIEIVIKENSNNYL